MSDFSPSHYGVSDTGYPQFGTTRCDECGELSPSFTQSGLPEHGIVLSIPSMGYYAGFTDIFPGDLDEEDENFRICHDCSVKLMEALPGLGLRIGSGGHPCSDETPCCNWAWKSDDGNVFIAENGKWVPLPDKPTG